MKHAPLTLHAWGAVLVVFVSAGCATRSSHSSAGSDASSANPFFTITLHCAPDVETVDWEEEGATEPVSNPVAETIPDEPVLAGPYLDVSPASEEWSDADYECFTLLEAMQDGAQSLMPQARLERNR